MDAEVLALNVVEGTTVAERNECISSNRQMIQDTALQLKDMIEAGEIESQDCPVVHRFAPGCYLREILMKKGTRIIGKIHSTEHFNIVLTGSATVITAEETVYIEAPHTFISKAGVQKVVVVHEDCLWQTVHVTESNDLEEIERAVVVESYDDLVSDGLLMNIKE